MSKPRPTIEQLTFPGAEPPQGKLNLHATTTGYPPGYRADDASSPHLSRTLMLAELTDLLAAVPDFKARPADYRAAVIERNALHKNSESNRKGTYALLRTLYILDPTIPSFRAFRRYYEAEAEARPLLCALVAYIRDPAFRIIAPHVLSQREFTPVPYQDLQEVLEQHYGNRFSQPSYKALAQHIASSYAQIEHLAGVKIKERIRAKPTPAAVAYALELAQLAGLPPEARLATPYIKLLDCTPERAIALTEDASRLGYLQVKRIGELASVYFPADQTSRIS